MEQEKVTGTHIW